MAITYLKYNLLLCILAGAQPLLSMDKEIFPEIPYPHPQKLVCSVCIYCGNPVNVYIQGTHIIIKQKSDELYICASCRQKTMPKSDPLTDVTPYDDE